MASGGAGVAKVLVVGDVATGKTSAIQRYVRGVFNPSYQTTIGVDFALKKVNVAGSDINVQLWDIAGQERFSGLSRIFYTHAVAAIVVYDVTSRESFDSAGKWKRDIDAKVFLPSGSNIPVLLIGNKADIVDDGGTACASDAEVDHFVREQKFDVHFKCSAKTGLNIEAACTHLVTRIAENIKREAQLEAEAKAAESGSGAGSSAAAGGASAAPKDEPSTVKLGSDSKGDGAPKESKGCCS